MRTVTVYRRDGTKIECLPGQVEMRNDFDVENKGSMSEKILNGYYEMEQQQGSRFKSGYSKKEIKRTHEEAIARGDG